MENRVKSQIFSFLIFLAVAMISLFSYISPQEFHRPSLYLALSGAIVLVSIIVLKRNFSLFVSQSFFLIIFLSYPLLFWQAKATNLSFPGVFFILPVFVYLVMVLSFKSIKEHVTWLRTGRIDRLSLVLMIVTLLGSALGLICWTLIMKPDLNVFMQMVTDLAPAWLILGGVLFALTNAFVEELIFRGILWDGLNTVIKNIPVIVIFQALLFGVWHMKGFPSGAVGIVLVFIWGIFLGIVRHRSKGMLAPYLLHVFADLTIFVVLFAIIEMR